jgi:hypothetical protein
MILQSRIIAFSLTLFITVGIMFISSPVAAKPHFSVSPAIVKNSDLSVTADYEAKDLGKKNSKHNFELPKHGSNWMPKSRWKIISI